MTAPTQSATFDEELYYYYDDENNFRRYARYRPRSVNYANVDLLY